MTTAEFRAAQKLMGVTNAILAARLGIRERAVERIRAGGTITGPMALAVQHLLDKHSATPKNQENSSE